MKNIVFENEVDINYILCNDEPDSIDMGFSESDVWKYCFKNTNFHFFLSVSNKDTYVIDFANTEFIKEALKDVHSSNSVKLRVDFINNDNEIILSKPLVYKFDSNDYLSIEIKDSNLLDKLLSLFKVNMVIESIE